MTVVKCKHEDLEFAWLHAPSLPQPGPRKGVQSTQLVQDRDPWMVRCSYRKLGYHPGAHSSCPWTSTDNKQLTSKDELCGSDPNQFTLPLSRRGCHGARGRKFLFVHVLSFLSPCSPFGHLGVFLRRTGPKKNRFRYRPHAPQYNPHIHSTRRWSTSFAIF